MELKRQLGLASAALIIVADMIGTGIFVITGGILGITGSSAATLGLWLAGGLAAITGALCYAELATMWPGNGGEYLYLRKIYGRLPAFLTGWISLTVGFTASVAATALTLVWYLGVFVVDFYPDSFLASAGGQKAAAAGVIVFFGLVHIAGVKRGGLLQNILTGLKLLIVAVFIVWGLAAADFSNGDRLTSGSLKGIGEYGLALLIVMFAYSGWNGATYIAGEIKNPERTLPRAMFIGVGVVALLYFLLNVVFLLSAPSDALAGSDVIAAVAAENLFGSRAAELLSLGIALVLFSAVSVQMMVGPRVYHAMAGDGLLFPFFGKLSRFDTPAPAILVQTVIAVTYVLIGRDNIDMLLSYIGFALSVFPLMSVIGLSIMRLRQPAAPRPFKVPFFPLTPAIYILLTIGMMTASLCIWTNTSLVALAVLAAGVGIYFVWQRLAGKCAEEEKGDGQTNRD